MKIQFQSDLHLEHFKNAIHYSIPQTDADVIVIAGDIGASSPKTIDWLIKQAKSKPIIVCLGNHEFYNQDYHQTLNFWQKELHDTNVFFLENDQIQIDDTVFIGATFWTDYALFGKDKIEATMNEAGRRMNDHYHINIKESGIDRLFSPLDAKKIHLQNRAFLIQSLEATQKKSQVIVTHHAPSLKSIPKKYHDQLLCGAFASNCEDLILKHQPKLWIHGHLHNNSDYLLGSTRILANPRGGVTDGNNDFKPNWLIEIN